jgi:DNA-binding CsgD family transcriptional regulator
MRRGRPPHPELLTPREQEVLVLLRQRLSNDEIARRLGISRAGAKYHVGEILSKLGVHSRHETAGLDPKQRRFAWAPPLGATWAQRLIPAVSLVSATTVVAVAVVAIALLAAGLYVMDERQSANGGNATAGPDAAAWLTYANEQHGYSIEYPPSWDLAEGATLCEPGFCVQNTELRGPDGAQVYVFVNFQGGWCEGMPPPVVTDIVVDGRSGKEYLCTGFTIRSFGDGDALIRYFPTFPIVAGGPNYVILGQTRTDLTEIRRIVESFRFLP